MSTVFPFNQIPKVPLTVLSALLPIILKQKKLLTKLVDGLEQKVSNLSKNAKCGDSNINDIKNDLARIQKVLNNINTIYNALQPLTTTLQTVATVANILSTIQLAIPAVPGVPTAPTNQALSSFAELIQNITIIINILNTLVKTINTVSKLANSVVSTAESKLDTICIKSDNANSSNITNATETEILNAQYPSEFYRDLNVSNSDIQDRVSQIQDLLKDQLDVIQNLNEAPSKVFTGLGYPLNNIGTDGDYYIDTNTQTVYGPKPSQNSWT